LNCQLEKQADGRMTCAFALPSVVGKHTAVVRLNMSLNDKPLEIAWEGGTTQLKPSKKDIYSPATCPIPPEVLEDIAAHGGIVRFTLPPGEGFEGYFGVFVLLQEKKS